MFVCAIWKKSRYGFPISVPSENEMRTDGRTARHMRRRHNPPPKLRRTVDKNVDFISKKNFAFHGSHHYHNYGVSSTVKEFGLPCATKMSDIPIWVCFVIGWSLRFRLFSDLCVLFSFVSPCVVFGRDVAGISYALVWIAQQTIGKFCSSVNQPSLP